jgi:CRISPR system Cascade subunit CasE
MAFPSADRKAEDAEFLKPFKPEDFGQPVHVPRGADAGFLFRIDPRPGGNPAMLVQSAAEPDWDYAFRNAHHLLAAPPEVKPFDLSFSEGQLLRFRLRANPTKKLKVFDENGERSKNGKRVGLYKEEEQRDWLDRKGHDGGSRVISCDVIPEAKTHILKPEDGSRTSQAAETENGKPRRPLLAVRFDGVLEVTNSEKIQETLAQGIGSAKAFGFGLLSLARCE